jgi:hypothetical protein
VRFHEALLCVVAVMLPLAAAIIFRDWQAPLIAFAVSLGLIRLVGWMVEHS